MKKFLRRLAIGLLQLVLAFLALAVAARFVGPINWFFFQKNQHDRVFYTLLEAENALRSGKKFDVLIFGSSTCENAIDPRAFTEQTNLSVFKFVTGAQTIDMSVALARYFAPRLRPKFVLIDAYPRYGGGLTEEGVSRAIMNAPDANSELTHQILAVDPYSLTTDYLWLARAIGTKVKPYDASSIMPNPAEFEMIAPGFTRTVVDPPAQPAPFSVSMVPDEAVHAMEDLRQDLAKTGQQLVVIVPPLQNARIEFQGPVDFPLIRPTARPDTCFFDAKHLRNVCTSDYTLEIADRFRSLLRASNFKPSSSIFQQTVQKLD